LQLLKRHGVAVRPKDAAAVDGSGVLSAHILSIASKQQFQGFVCLDSPQDFSGGMGFVDTLVAGCRQGCPGAVTSSLNLFSPGTHQLPLGLIRLGCARWGKVRAGMGETGRS
jgi:hypothetical protein